MKPTNRRLILFFSLCHLFLLFSYTIFLAYLPPQFEQLGLDGNSIGILVSIFHLMTLPTVALFGFISDRFSPKRLFQLGAILYAIYAFGLSASTELRPLMLLQALGGGSYAICIVTLNSLYLKHLSSTHRGKKIGLFLACSYIGFGVGPLLAGWIAEWGDLSGVFRLACGSTVIMILLSMGLRDYPIRTFRLTEYTKDISNRCALLVIFALFSEGFHVGAEHTGFTLLMKHQIGFTAADIGLFYLFLGLWLALITYALGFWVDRHAGWIRFFMSAGVFISGIFQILTGMVHTGAQLVVVRYLHIVGDAILLWTISYFISIIFHNDRMGGNYGFGRVVNTLGTALGAFGFGMVMAKWGYSPPFYLSGIFEIGVAMILFQQRRYLQIAVDQDSAYGEVTASASSR